MKLLIEDIRYSSGINQIQAELALGAVLIYLAARLPSPIMGRIREVLPLDRKAEEHESSTNELGNAIG